MNAQPLKTFIRWFIVLIGLSVLLPACTTSGGTSGHVDQKLREHGV